MLATDQFDGLIKCFTEAVQKNILDNLNGGVVMCNSAPVVDVKVRKVNPEAIIPVYQKEGDSGFDLRAIKDVVIYGGQTVVVKTGLAFEIPKGYEMQIRPRSGLARDTPLIIPNSPGTIDSGYRGEVGIILHNTADGMAYTVHVGDRIAQGVIAPVVRARFVEVDELAESDRGKGGYGSTGYK